MTSLLTLNSNSLRHRTWKLLRYVLFFRCVLQVCVAFQGKTVEWGKVLNEETLGIWFFFGNKLRSLSTWKPNNNSFIVLLTDYTRAWIMRETDYRYRTSNFALILSQRSNGHVTFFWWLPHILCYFSHCCKTCMPHYNTVSQMEVRAVSTRCFWWYPSTYAALTDMES